MARKAQKTAAKAAPKAPARNIAPKAAKKHQPPQQTSPKASRQARRTSNSKSAAILAALQRDRGATVEDLMALTGWQAHSVRGFLSGTVRKKLALDVVTDGKGTARTYRITKSANVAKAA